MTRDGAPFDEMCEPGFRDRMAADPLSQYKTKRKFDETSEPEGKDEEGENKHRFVIQRHKAKKAGEHFDLRLENDEGAMSSWSIPKHKLPSGKEKLLAVKTEDHPLEYRTFKGAIPEGEYGAGEMDIHDSGTYEQVSWSSTKIVFRLKGKKEKGGYKLFKTDGKRWMIMAAKDEDLKKADDIPLSSRAVSGKVMPYSFQPHEEAPLSMREVNYKLKPGQGTPLMPKDPLKEWEEQQRKREEDKPPLSERDEPPASLEESKAPIKDKKEVWLLTFMDKMIGWYDEVEEAERALFHVIGDFEKPGADSTGASIVRDHFGPMAFATGGYNLDAEEKLEEFITEPSRGYWRKRFAHSVMDIRQYFVPADWEPYLWGPEKPEGDFGTLHAAAKLNIRGWGVRWPQPVRPEEQVLLAGVNEQISGTPEEGGEDDDILTVQRPYFMESVKDWMYGREPKKYPSK